jgi:hypothetical protein
MLRRVAIEVVALGVLLASAASAQTLADPVYPRSIDLGAQWSFPPGNRGLSGTPGVKISWRRWYGHHLGSEAHAGWWRGETSWEFNSPEFQSRNTDAVTAYSVAIGILGRIPLGRATVVLGVGPGWFHDRRDFEWRTNSASGEQHAAGGETQNSLGVHIVTEVDVRATRRMSVFGGFLSQVRNVRDRESSIVYPTAGLRFGF